MCSTCNPVNFTPNEDTKRLEQKLGMGGLLITCDSNGKNYKLAVENEPRSNYTIYRCPTCGTTLF